MWKQILRMGTLPIVFMGLCPNGCAPARIMRDHEMSILTNLESDCETKVNSSDTEGHITDLTLANGHVNEQMLASLAGLKNLRSLVLAKVDVTDTALIGMRALKRLQCLNVARTRISDRVILALRGQESLRYMWVTENDELTARGIRSLKNALPGVQVFVVTGHRFQNAALPNN